MSLSLSQLFEQHQSKYSSKSKKEESNELVEDGDDKYDDASYDRVKIDPGESENVISSLTNVTTKKRSRNALILFRQPAVDSDDDLGYKSTITKRIKTESSNGSNNEAEEATESEILDIEDNGNAESVVEEVAVDERCNRRFYENYVHSVEALYNFQDEKSKRYSHSEILETVHSALFPIKSKKSLAIGNDRRLVGNYDKEEEDDYYPSKSLSGRYRPRKRRMKSKDSSGKKEITYRLETQEEVKDRVRRMEEYDARRTQRFRWKTRTVDLQSEEDVGGAFLERAKQNLSEKLRANEKERRMTARRERRLRRKERRYQEAQMIEELERNDILEEDDEAKEQSQLLAQLSQQNTTVKQEDKDPTDTPNESDFSSSQKTNYWELGYAMPKNSSISYDFDPSVEKMVESGLEALENASKNLPDNQDAKEEIKASYNSLMHNQYTQCSSSRLFFAPNRTLISNGKTTFRPGYRTGHIHQMMNMAARSLCASGGRGSKDEIRLENRYLRLLCLRYENAAKERNSDSTICAGFCKTVYLTALAEEQGKNMLLFLQNTWDDPAAVAQKLGILNCCNESPIKGNLLTKIHLHSKKNRSNVIKLHKIRSVNWDHENNDEILSDNDDADEESAIRTIENIIPDVTTSDGIVDVMTMDTLLTIDKKLNLAPSKSDRDAFISPNTLFSHIAGTTPPIPQHPLDPSALMFGPVDRFSKFYHLGVRMDSSMYTLMLSTLMRRIGRARMSKNESILRDTQEQILNLIEEFANINENKFYLRYTNSIQDPLDSDIPLVEFYRGVAGYCNFMANSYIETIYSNTSPSEDGTEVPSNTTYDLRQDSRLNLIAEKIWSFCRLRIRKNCLMRFPRLRITFGIALICRSLSPSAAEILSRAIDDGDMTTPLDLFKLSLEDMEDKKYIDTNRNFENNSILAVELEFLLHDAAEFFQEAIELDPTNIEYQLWHIGCLASCLLVSSGNKISDSVHVYPSQMKGALTNFETVAHEVRPCLKKFKDVRVELSFAVQALLTLAKYQDSPRAHFAVFSLLEWGQVIGLLVGNKLNESLAGINRLHTFHFEQWAKHEPATFLREYKGVSQNVCVTSIYAQILENDPGDIMNWRNFVRCLGPISESKNEDWWGKDRSWWEDSLLHINTENIRDGGHDKARRNTKDEIFSKLQRVEKDLMVLTRRPSSIDGENNDNSDNQDVDWLPTHESFINEDNKESDFSIEQRARCYANDLPRAIRKTNSESSDCTSAFLSGTSIPSEQKSLRLDLSSLSQEVQGYKIFIFCHLFGVNHASVRSAIYHNIFCECARDKNNEAVDENCDEFRVLVWLGKMGINIEDIMKDF